MRILLVNKYYYLKGGAERYVFNLQGLLQEHGHKVEVFAMQHPRNYPATYQQDFVPAIDFYDLSILERIQAAFRVLWYPAAACCIARVLDDFQPDIVHLHNIYHQLSPSILPPIRKRRIPIVQTLHDYKLLCPNYQLYTQNAPCTRCRNRKYWQAIRFRCVHDSLTWSALTAVEMTLHKAWRLYESSIHTFITPSRFLQNMAQSFGIAPEQLSYIPHPFWVEDAPCSEDTAHGNYVAYVGRLSYEKGLSTLIRAIKKLPHVRLRIVGEGEMRPRLEQLATDSGPSNIAFSGYVQGAELVNALREARFTVLPSEWYEVFGQSIIESFMLGKPVIASRIGGIPELIDDGKDGLLFPPGNVDALAACIRQSWDHPQRTREMGLKGRQKILNTYTPEQHYAQVYPLYERLVNI